ncbi:MAG TPA: FAD-binding oxidoreductase [Ignavibacteriales bacterium]|nr:FAD-binding oxidoreductase [Ignavibacteriales bacterium]
MKTFSWGLYPKYNGKIINIYSKNDLIKYFNTYSNIIPYGNGRSYGDSAISDYMLASKKMNYFISFDEKNGILKCQSGVLLSEILDFIVPRGWFLSITPGTKLITIGGAIASDVHGKNHHKEGCFSNSVIELSLMLPNGDVIKVKNGDEMFLATCGGMGLTGYILDATIKLKKINSQFINQYVIKNKNLLQTFESFEKYANFTYSVAWIDCLADKKNLGKSIIMVGEFANDFDLEYKEKKKLNVPFLFPDFALNTYSVKLFNYMYYNVIENSIDRPIKVHYDKFFYPLDSINNWNRIYGKNGFTQYQFIIPKDKSFDALSEILYEIHISGKGSFLSVLKLYGKENNNYLSFPIEGYSLALDFKIDNDIFDFLDKLDKIVLKYGGRIYLTKDARLNKETFYKAYQKLDYFLKIRNQVDPNKKINSLQSRRLGL